MDQDSTGLRRHIGDLTSEYSINCQESNFGRLDSNARRPLLGPGYILDEMLIHAFARGVRRTCYYRSSIHCSHLIGPSYVHRIEDKQFDFKRPLKSIPHCGRYGCSQIRSIAYSPHFVLLSMVIHRLP